MIKVFLVEDEAIIRNGIRNIINWEKEGFEFVGEAGDGELAYPLIKKLRPDILITDIRMPFMDGLELSRIVKNELPATKIMIVSGYGEFDYAKQAISIGVTDYLLKPISSAKLLEAVRQVADLIKQEREKALVLSQYKKDMEESCKAARKKLFGHVVSGTLSTMEILEEGRKLDIEFGASFYAAALLQLIPCSNNRSAGKELEQVRAEMELYLDGQQHIRMFHMGIEGFVMIFEGDDGKDINKLLEELGKYLKKIVNNHPELQYFVGAGRPVRRLGDIPRSYQEAGRAFASRFFIELNQIVDVEQAERYQSRSNVGINLEELRNSKIGRIQVENFLKNGTAQEADEFIEEYFHNVGENNYQSLMFRQYIVMDMFLGAVDCLESLDISVDRLSESSRNFNEIACRICSLEDVKRSLLSLFLEALNLRDSISHKKYSLLLEEAQNYIGQNFQNNEISLNQVASFVNVSPSYFSTIFSQETGETFVEYLTRLRIEKAKEMLMCTSFRTSEIGYQVGYKDPHYFSYIFKKTVNCTPKEYRMRGKDRQETQ